MSEHISNLLIGTKDWSGSWNNISGWYTDGTYNGFKVMSRKDAWGGINRPVMLTAGKTYTFSACVKVEPFQNHPAFICITLGETINDYSLANSEIEGETSRYNYFEDADWHIISLTFTPKASKRAIARVDGNGGYVLSVCAYMLAEGDTPAAWAPAEGESLAADAGGGRCYE